MSVSRRPVPGCRVCRSRCDIVDEHLSSGRPGSRASPAPVVPASPKAPRGCRSRRRPASTAATARSRGHRLARSDLAPSSKTNRSRSGSASRPLAHARTIQRVLVPAKRTRRFVALAAEPQHLPAGAPRSPRRRPPRLIPPGCRGSNCPRRRPRSGRCALPPPPSIASSPASPCGVSSRSVNRASRPGLGAPGHRVSGCLQGPDRAVRELEQLHPAGS